MELSKLAVKRLKTLIRFMGGLDKRANRHFKMRHWASHRGNEKIISVHGLKVGERVTKGTLLDCGMSACAAGWACVSPLQREGLKAIVHRDGVITPVYQDATSISAVQRFFDVGDEAFSQFFGHRRRIDSPTKWADRARKLVDKATVTE